MTSAIDPTKPTEGTATTESVRQNFDAAKTEIEQLQDDVAAAAIAWRAAYPIGSIYISVLATDPNTMLGFGTWASIGAGRVLVGQDTGDGDFDTLEETGGDKTVTLTEAEMPSHTHTQDAHNHTQNSHNHNQNSHVHAIPLQNAGNTTGTFGKGGASGSTNANTNSATATNIAATATNIAATAVNQSTCGDTPHNNLQPYFVVKMWKRTA